MDIVKCFLAIAILCCVSLSCIQPSHSVDNQVSTQQKPKSKLDAEEGSKVVLEGIEFTVAINNEDALFLCSTLKVPTDKAIAIWNEYRTKDDTQQIAFYLGNDIFDKKTSRLYCYSAGSFLFYEGEIIE